jgi:iron(III) transport system substrate-binding protein
VAIIKGAPHPEAARLLVDYLLSPAVETQLAQGRSAQIPLNRQVTARARVETPSTVQAMQVDFEAAAKKWETAALFLRDLVTRPL